MTSIHHDVARQSSEALLGAAVHKNPATSADGLLERLFTLAFSGLVYPQIWEDPRVDLQALALTPSSRIVTIASGGCNVLNYLCEQPEQIFAVDLNSAHVALNRLKLTALRHLPGHDAFFQFFGKAHGPDNVPIFKTVIEPHLDGETRAYWNKRNAWGRRNIDAFGSGFYRTGLLGRFIGFAHVVSKLHGVDPREMMSASRRAEQAAFFERKLAPLFDRTLIRWVLGHRAALYGLGIPPPQYDALLGDATHMAEVVRERLRKLACDFDLADNYFAWQAFARSYAPDTTGPLPAYLQAGNFDLLKSSVDRVSVELTSFTQFLRTRDSASLDRYVLLDAQDWMDDATLSALWAEITRTARPDARVIFRTAAPATVLPGRLSQGLLDRWHYDQKLSKECSANDRSAIYGGFHLYVLKPN
jgi:S-adenosylmethionine-diacylglycerol 3-amino-3-carboxypropyl transferase